MPYIEENWKKL